MADSRPHFYGSRFETPCGAAHVVVDEKGAVRRLVFEGPDAIEVPSVEQRPSRTAAVVKVVRDYLLGRAKRLTGRVVLDGSEFQLEVWRALRRVPRGRAITFGQLAALVGRPSAVRACTRAVVLAPVELFVPTHRLVGTGGRITGPPEVAARRAWLLRLEGALGDGDRVDGARLWQPGAVRTTSRS